MNKVGVVGVVGFTTERGRGIPLDLNIGVGFGDVDVNTIVNDYGRYDTHAQIEGRNNYTVLVLQLSAKFCISFKGKSK